MDIINELRRTKSPFKAKSDCDLCDAPKYIKDPGEACSRCEEGFYFKLSGQVPFIK